MLKASQNNSSQLEKDNSQLFHWNKLQQNNDCSIPSRHHHRSIIYKNHLIILGGQQDDGKLPEELLTYDMQKLVWSEIPLLGGSLSARFGFSVCMDDQDRIIIYGGIGQENRNNFINKIEILELCDSKDLIFEKKELHIGSMNIARAYHSANFHENKIYIFGGQTAPQNEDNHLFIFNLESNSIIQKETYGTLPDSRCQHSSGIFQNKLYIYGGYQTIKGSWGYYETCLGDLWALDLSSFKWNKLEISEKHPGPRKNASMNIIENKIFIFGGSNEKTQQFNDLVCYNIDDGSSEIILTTGDIPSARTFHSCSLYSNNMIIFGGINCDSTIYSLHLSHSGKDNKEISFSSNADQARLVQLGKDLENLFIQKNFTDVIFQVENQLIPAHKCLLAIRCPYFQEIFQKNNNSSNIIINNIKPKVFNVMLEYLYSSKIDVNNQDLAMNLLKAATEYKLEELKNICETFLRKNIDMNNAVNLSIIAEECQASDLKNDVISFFSQHMDDIKKNNDFVRAPQSIMTEALKSEVLPPADV